MRKFECNRDVCPMRPCRIEVTDRFAEDHPRCVCHSNGFSDYPAEWKEIHTDVSGSQEWGPHVFRRTDCPEWAMFAAVDRDDKGYWYSDEPSLDGSYWRKQEGSKLMRIGEGRFKVSGRWEDTLLKRGVPLARGQWVEFDGGQYGKITSINKDGSYWLSTLKGPQRVADVTKINVTPLGDADLRGLVGDVLECYRWTGVVTSAEPGGCGFRVKVCDQVFNAEQLLEEAIFYKGHPCGSIE